MQLRDILTENTVGFRAYHASPHKFDMFDNSFIGTGQRNASFGHGLYFTETLAVAKHYQRELRRKFPTIYYDDKAISRPALGKLLGFKPDKLDRNYEWRCLTRLLSEYEESNEPLATIIQAQIAMHRGNDRLAQIFQHIGEHLEGHIRFGGPSAFIYEVRIDVPVDHLLDQNRSINMQSRYIQQALVGHFSPADNGWTVYMRLADKPEAASAWLLHHGIAGMQYFDQLSRVIAHDGEKSRNYVIFDPMVITVMRRFKLGAPDRI